MKNALMINGGASTWAATGLLTLAAGLACWAGDWPQFMGPNGNGVSTEKGLLRAWPVDGPKVLWTVSLGSGYGNAAVRGGKVYVLDRVEQKQDVLRCLNLNTGKEEWTLAYDAPGRIDHEGSRSTPAVSEKRVFIQGPFGQFHAIDQTTHQVVWMKNLIADFGARQPRWAISQSPLLYQDLVIVAPLSEKAGMVAFEQATGNERWRSPALGPLDYASPKLIHLDGMDQFVIVNGRGVVAVSAVDGKKLWDYAHPCRIPVPNVSVLGQGKLFVTGGYNAGSAIIQVSRADAQWNVKELARINFIGGHCHPGLVYQNHIYVLCNTNERKDGMVCFDFDGKLVWQTKNEPNLDKGGSLLTGDGLMYVMDGRTGELYIVEPSPEGFKALDKAKLLEGREIWAPLVLADGKLIIRDQSQMKCLNVKAN